MAVTIKDIANRLGLSVGAVSCALSGYTDIAEDTRQRIFEAAREMGYTPNRAARQLRKQTVGTTIGYIMPVDSPRFADSYFSEFIEGLGDETAAQQSDLLIGTARPGQEAEKMAYQLVRLRAAQIFKQPRPSPRIVLQPTLLLRASTGRPKQ
jgi:LacI family transcriptional regulator